MNSVFQIFVGTLPILMTLIWGVTSNERGIARIERRLKELDPLIRSNYDRIMLAEAHIKNIEILSAPIDPNARPPA